jgi:hypothetical protein
MQIFAKFVAIVAAPMLLTGCFFLPGKFDATLKLNKGGLYAFTYVGEMQVIAGDDKDMSPPKLIPFNPNFAECSDWIDDDGTIDNPETSYDRYAAKTAYQAEEGSAVDAMDALDSDVTTGRVQRVCTAEELAALELTETERHDRKMTEYDEKSGMMAAMFGGAIPVNEKALKKIATQLMKYDGWEKVEYAGKNKFNVEYRATGTFDRYFAFPVLNDANMQYPFFQVVPRKSGALEIMAPAIGGSGSFMSMAMMGGMRGGMPKDMPISEISGSFTVETDGEVLANNSPDGYESNGDTKTMRWNVKDIAESPKVLIKVK